MASRLDAAELARVCGGAPVFLSSISLGELHYGVQVCTDPLMCAKRQVQMRKLGNRPTLPVTAETAAVFGALAAALHQTGRSPRPRHNGLWIAAQAVENDHALLTLNPGDFTGLPGLRLLTLLPDNGR